MTSTTIRTPHPMSNIIRINHVFHGDTTWEDALASILFHHTARCLTRRENSLDFLDTSGDDVS